MSDYPTNQELVSGRTLTITPANLRKRGMVIGDIVMDELRRRNVASTPAKPTFAESTDSERVASLFVEYFSVEAFSGGRCTGREPCAS